MKNLLKFTILLFVALHYSNFDAQNRPAETENIDISFIVLKNFNAKFPVIEPVWSIDYQGENNTRLVYEAKFILNNRSVMVVYDNDGTLLAYAETIGKNELPEKISSYMSENFPYLTIKEAILVTRGKNSATYEVGVFIDNQYVIQVFSKEGDFIRSTKA